MVLACLKGPPSQLVRNLNIIWFPIFWVPREFLGGRLKGGMGRGWENAVKPCLQIFAPRRCESGTRKLLRVETVRNLLRGVLPYWEGALNGLRSKAMLIVLFAGLAETS